MNWHEPIDIYCERLDAGFWAEPLNAITNLSFLLAAWWLWLHVRSVRNQIPGPITDIASLIILVAIIGFGSFAFHTLGTRGAMMADVIPIFLFTCTYLVIALHVLLGMRWRFAVLGLLAYLAGSHGFLWLTGPNLMNGSIGYVPSLIMTLGLGLYVYFHRGQKAGRFLLAAGGVFILSIIFRSIDMMLCPALPLGTHYFWHILNGVVLTLLVWGIIEQRKKATL